LLSSGATEAEAYQQTLAELSGGELLRRELRRVERQINPEPIALGANRRTNMIADLWQDLRYGARMLLKKPGFTLIASMTLGLGIGANTAIFSVVNALLVRPLPLPEPERIVYLWENNLQIGVRRGIASPANFLDWRERSRVFEHLSAWRTWFYTLTGGDQPEQVWGVRASANFFQLLGVSAQLGRTFLPQEDRAGRDSVVVISHGLWQRRFGADPNIVGQTMTIDGRPFTVVGVLPPGFSLFGTQRPYDLWMPFVLERSSQARDDHSILVFARLKAGVTLRQAQTEMSAIARQLEEEYPATNRHRGVQVITLGDNQREPLRPALLILLAAVGFVLLIVCANVANLMLARAAVRKKELAIRAALGASRLRLMQQLLIESLLLALMGGALGLLLAVGGLDLLRALLPSGGADEIPRADWIAIDRTVFGFTLVLSLVTGILFGLGPALASSRVNLNESLNEGARGLQTSRRGRRWLSALVVSEIALALVLMVGAGLLLKSFHRLLAVDPGIQPENLLTMQLWLPESKYKEDFQVAAFHQQTLERVRTLPGVRAASAINFLPLSGWGDGTGVALEGRAPRSPGDGFSVQYRVIDADYFRAMGVALMRGRAFTERDRADAEPVVIINETMARQHWLGEEPIGKRLRPIFPATGTPWRPLSSDAWLTIIGVARDVKEFGLGEGPAPQIYLSSLQHPSRLMRLVVRTASEPLTVAAAVERAVQAVDKDQPVTEIKTMEQFIAESVSRRRFNLWLLGIFAAIALVLAVAGIYGVMAYSVSARTRELGIRLALGARDADVLRLVLREGATLIVAGLALGLPAAWAALRILQSQLYDMSTTDPATFAVVALVLAGVALAACWIPARRAMRIDPLVALRYE
jgi:putative ABC transport system permease protein